MTTRGTWCGKPIEEMTREELMDAVEMLGKQLSDANRSGLEAIRFMAAAVRTTMEK